MARFKTNPWDLRELLAMLDSGKIVLPEFQRSFVWRPADIDLLITSLVQDYPAGSLLFVRSGGTADLAWRAVEGVEPNPTVSPDYLVLDGQQRLTSLSLALNGRGSHLFFMNLDMLDGDDLESGIYPLRAMDARRKNLDNREGQWAAHVYPVSAALGEGEDEYWFEDYIEYHVAQGEDRARTRARARHLRDDFIVPLKNYRFPVVELPAETTLEAVCQIFENLNKTGMKLTVFDLLAARFWPRGLNLRQLYQGVRDEYPLLGPDQFDVEETYLLQAVSLIRSDLCQKGNLLTLNRKDFEDDWASVCRGASAALTMLRGECGILTRKWLPYAALFPALFAISARMLDLRGPDVGVAWEKVKRWFWCACFSQRYDGPVNTVNAQDWRQLQTWLEGDAAIPQSVSQFSLADLNLRETARQNSAVYRSVICLTIVNGARDFHSGRQLTFDALSDPAQRIEDHHIFPSGFLQREFQRAPENSILNRCLIDHSTNRMIQDERPSNYLAVMEDRLGKEKVEDILISHLIPTDGPGNLGGDDLESFLREREVLLLEAVASVTGSDLSAVLPNVEVYLDPRRGFTNELALRRVVRSLQGDLFWYEQHMSRKALEVLIEEVNRDLVRRISLLSGPANVSESTKRAFRQFSSEMDGDGMQTEWRIVTAERSRDMHARVMFDDYRAWELPPLNSLLRGTVDSIRISNMPREPFLEAWSDASPLEEMQLDRDPDPG